MKRPQFSLAVLLWVFVALGGFVGFIKSIIDSLNSASSTSTSFLWQYWASFLCVAI